MDQDSEDCCAWTICLTIAVILAVCSDSTIIQEWQQVLPLQVSNSDGDSADNIGPCVAVLPFLAIKFQHCQVNADVGRVSVNKLNPIRSKSSKVEEAPKVNDKPLPFLSSDAAKWKAIYSTAGDRVLIRPRYENLVIAFSLTIFMIYFCILREENDLDDWLVSLQDDVPMEVQELKLRSAIADGVRQGRDTKELRKQLAEIIRIRKEMSASRTS